MDDASLIVVDDSSYVNEEDCEDDYVESEQQIMNVGGLCIYAQPRGSLVE